MPQEGYANPVANDEARFRSITPVSELTELVFEPERSGQAMKLSPSGCEELDGVMHITHIDPHKGPTGLGGSRQKPGTATPNSPLYASDCALKTLGPRPRTHVDKIYDIRLRLGPRP